MMMMKMKTKRRRREAGRGGTLKKIKHFFDCKLNFLFVARVSLFVCTRTIKSEKNMLKIFRNKGKKNNQINTFDEKKNQFQKKSHTQKKIIYEK